MTRAPVVKSFAPTGPRDQKHRSLSDVRFVCFFQDVDRRTGGRRPFANFPTLADARMFCQQRRDLRPAYIWDRSKRRYHEAMV